MPTHKDSILKTALRLAAGQDIRQLTSRLHPDPSARVELPNPVPQGPDGMAARIALLKEKDRTAPFLTGAKLPSRDPEDYRGQVENFIGLTQTPTGLAGPLRINGLHAHGDYMIPLATSEGALVASYSRGCRILSKAGGVSALVLNEQVQRSPAFLFRTVSEAAHFSVWVSEHFETLKEVAQSRTRHGELVDISLHMEANQVHLMLQYYTGDAAGQNMVTFCSDAICRHILDHSPVAPRRWYIESNMSGDKKATAQSLQGTRGRKVIAEAVLAADLVEKVLRTSPAAMNEYWRTSFVAGSMTGSIGASGHIANALAALFLACGQDVACVSEASIGLTRMEQNEDGDLYVSLTLPNLIVGTVGGGTSLPTARECLQILGCEGTGGARAFAEICAATALAGEVSIIGALCSGDFANAHEDLGRKR